jgi:hypothetical protein
MSHRDLSHRDWLRLGVWGRREEARKSWDYIRSDEIVYSCDFLPAEFQGNNSGRVQWISKYQLGGAWLEYHGILGCQRPTHFYALVEFMPQITYGSEEQLEVHRSSAGPSVLVDIAEFVKLPKGIVPIACPSIVRLKIFDDSNGSVGDVANEPFESLLCARGLIGMNREHNITRGTSAPQKSQLPSQLIESGPKIVDNVCEAEINISFEGLKLTPTDVTRIHQIIFFRDCIWVGPTKLHNKGIEFLEVFIRPSNLRLQISEPAADDKVRHGFTLPTAL